MKIHFKDLFKISFYLKVLIFVSKKVRVDGWLYIPLMKIFPNREYLAGEYFTYLSHHRGGIDEFTKDFIVSRKNRIGAPSPLKAFEISLLRHLFFSAQYEKVKEVVENERENLQDYFRSTIYPHVIFGLFDLSEIEELVGLGECKKHFLEPKYKQSFTFPRELKDELEPKRHFEVEIPENSVYQLENCSVVGAAQVVKGEKFVLYEKAANPFTGSVSGSWNYVTAFQAPSCIFICHEAKSPKRVEQGILIGGRSWYNYFHFLIEYASHLYAIEKAKVPKNIPLLIQEKIFPQMKEALKIISGSRPIIEMSEDTIYECEELWIPSYPMALYDNLNGKEFWEISGLSFKHLSFVREKVFRAFQINEKNENNNKRLIYISRKSYKNRSLVNEPEFEEQLLKMNFEIVRPEELSFREQVKVFSSADVIVSPSGAGLANTVFSKKGSKLVVILHEALEGYCLFSNISQLNEVEYFNCYGKGLVPQAEGQDFISYAFGPFELDIEKCSQRIRKIID